MRQLVINRMVGMWHRTGDSLQAEEGQDMVEYALLAALISIVAIAIILLVAAEMIGAERGIGAFVLQAGNLYDTDNLLAGIVVLSLLGLAVAAILGVLDRWLLRWR